MAAKFFGQLAGLSAYINQFDHLGRYCCGLWRLGITVETHLDSFLTSR